MKIQQQNKYFLWLPYTSDIQIKGKLVKFIYNSGTEIIPFKRIHSIMFYGSVVDLSQAFLENCSKERIPIVIHRRNMTRAVWIMSSTHTNSKDLLTKQIIARENKIKQRYIARQLIKAKFKSSNWLTKTKPNILKKDFTISQIRAIEAIRAKHYWEVYFRGLNHPEWGRRDKNPVSKILDAVSKFLAGILLRWILYHNLSPYHGYMHIQTEYPSLVYDIMDPYRGYFDRIIFKTIKKAQNLKIPESKWIGYAIRDLKIFLNSHTYTEATRQIVTMSELMHGVVLALRSYLLGDSYRFIIPIPGRPNGGRPIKAGYTLYGRRAGRTDFWEKANQVAKKHRELTARAVK